MKERGREGKREKKILRERGTGGERGREKERELVLTMNVCGLGGQPKSLC